MAHGPLRPGLWRWAPVPIPADDGRHWCEWSRVVCGQESNHTTERGAGEGPLSVQRLLSCALHSAGGTRLSWEQPRGAHWLLREAEGTPLTVTRGLRGIRATSRLLKKGEESFSAVADVWGVRPETACLISSTLGKSQLPGLGAGLKAS